MKRIWNVVVLTLAMNFAMAAAGVGWLAASGHLTRQRMADVRQVLFPPATRPAAAAAATTTQPTSGGTLAADADPVDRLGALLAKAAGRPPGGRLEAAQEVQEVDLAELDRRRREAADVRRQAELAESQAKADHDAVDRERQAFTAQRDQQAAAAADKGFQDSLELYRTLPAKQVKAIFLSLPDETVQRYFQAMDPREAGKIMKEYKSPAEAQRLEVVLEKIRQAPAAATPPADQNAPAGVASGR